MATALSESQQEPTDGQPLGRRVPRYRSVLLVEDELPFRRALARNLTNRGVEVREAGTAEEAIAAATQARPELLLLDISLPDRSGWDVLRELRWRGITAPTIVLSATRVLPQRLTEFRPLACLPKPFPLEALLRLVIGSNDEGPAAETAGSHYPESEEDFDA